MHLKKIFAALLACLALGAVAANSAQAEGKCWTIEGVCLKGAEEVKVERHPGSGVLQLTAELLNKKLTLDANKVECAAGAACTIDNVTAPNHSAGKLEFTEVTVTEPANCTVHSPEKPNGTVVTTALTDTVKMDATVGSTAVLDTFFPETGTKFAELEFTGALCPFNELVVPVEGEAVGLAVFEKSSTEKDFPAKTEELRVVQSLTFNEAAQKTGGAVLYLRGTKPSQPILTGQLITRSNQA